VDGTGEVNVIVLVNTKSRIIHQIDGYESIERSGGVGRAAQREGGTLTGIKWQIWIEAAGHTFKIADCRSTRRERARAFVDNGEGSVQRRTERRRAKIIRSALRNEGSIRRIDRHARHRIADRTGEVDVIVTVGSKIRVIHLINGYKASERSGGVGRAAQREGGALTGTKRQIWIETAEHTFKIADCRSTRRERARAFVDNGEGSVQRRPSQGCTKIIRSALGNQGRSIRRIDRHARAGDRTGDGESKFRYLVAIHNIEIRRDAIVTDCRGITLDDQ